MPLSIHSRNHKFLLDENVHRELYKFLKKQNFDVKQAPKSISDMHLAEISKNENRILVTNDEDFIEYTKEYVFSVVLLRIAQGNVDALIASFDKLLNNFKKFSGRLVILKTGKWEDFLLGQEIKL